MTTSISHGGTTLYPTKVTGWQTERTSGNTIHPVINSSDPAVTFAPATLRKGTIKMHCATRALALSLEALHLGAGKFTITESHISLSMAYVPSGKITVALDVETDLWAVEVDFHEVTP